MRLRFYAIIKVFKSFVFIMIFFCGCAQNQARNAEVSGQIMLNYDKGNIHKKPSSVNQLNISIE